MVELLCGLAGNFKQGNFVMKNLIKTKKKLIEMCVNELLLDQSFHFKSLEARIQHKRLDDFLNSLPYSGSETSSVQ